jgi:class 3 adenylate cyclase/tetratricopeptide (TPR) repeat protein
MPPMRCGTCQADNRSGARFCEDCGARLAAECPACGARVAADKRFCGDCGAPRPAFTAPPAAGARFASPRAYTPPHLAERILEDRSALTGERKQVTVLFADVSRFTAISEQLDPEEVHVLINRAFELMLEEIHRYEGTVNQFLGDGIMALFGAPIAHEHHAQRAAHAALGIQEALGGLRDELQRERGIDFLLRMGINSGLVVVGAIGDNLRMDYTAVGDTTNTAARMQQLAQPGQIVVAEATHRLIGPFFELRQLGSFALKNRTRPVAAWELVRARATTSRLAARVARGLSPFVGRDDEFRTLERAFAAARGGRGQVVFVVGDAGIGKSRLLLEFRERLAGQVAWMQGDCVSFGQSIPFLPIVEMLRRHAGIDDGDADAGVSATIDPYLRYLLGLDPGDPAVTAMDPQQRRTCIGAAILRLIAASSRQRPVVLLVEDAHWIDSASEAFLTSLTETVAGLALLLIVTYRPVYQQPFGDRTYYWRIPMQPLEDPDAAQIVRAALGVEDLPGELAGLIAGKAEGNPFFIEEMGRTLVETGAVGVEDGRLVATRPAATIVVPDTVQDVIAARIDRLEEAQKRTVQAASVIGREFVLAVLQRVCDVPSRLETCLGELKRSELIHENAGHGDPEYAFRHALTQDVAYASLLQSERKRLHARTGAALEELFAGRIDERVEQLVHHFARGEVWDKVVRYAREAGERAAALCVDDRAVEFYDTAVRALRHLPETPETARAGIDVRLAMRAPLWRGGQPERLFSLFKEAEVLAGRHGHTDALDTIAAFLVQYHWARGEHAEAIAYGQRCLARAAEREDLGLRVTGLLYLGHTYHALGRYADSVQAAREVEALLQGDRAQQRFGLSGLPCANACARAAESLAEVGDEVGARAMLDRAQRVADAADHRYSQMVVAAARGAVLVDAGRPEEAIAVLEPAVRDCREKHFVGQLINALKHLGRAYTRAGRPADAIPVLRQSIELQEKASVYVQRPLKYASLARAWLAVGDLEQAEANVRRALEFAERNGERPWGGWARLVAAGIAARRGDRPAAERDLDEAQAIAEELGMRPLLEACGALARRLG